MIISITSGKGGTGKTLISTNLAAYLVRSGMEATYADADAEEPNGHLFLNPVIVREEPSNVTVPYFKVEECSGCHACQKICSFNAIINFGKKVTVFEDLCHGCGACVLACKENSLGEKKRETGKISYGNAGGINFISGRLNIGESRVTPLIEDVVKKSSAESNDSLLIIDSPPGTSCSAMAAAHNCDLMILVTEPTPFGLHDLKLAVEMGKALNRKMAAIINRSDLGTDDTLKYLNKNNIEILATIPFDKEIAVCGAKGRLAIDSSEQFKNEIASIAEHVVGLHIGKGGNK
ncbi:MAG: ATP-binding protein [Deltaproteobacteria bacterium]|nr:ATP-binding protein [Deltaproteobacteria bacterium]